MHLIRRFFGFLTAAPLTPSEQMEVRKCLTPGLAAAFFAQPYQDQRHALDVKRLVEHHDHLYEAALLHDLGKTVSDLGAVGRSLATVFGFLRLPLPRRWLQYLDHGPLGAKQLEDVGACDLTVAFARYHPGVPPPGIDEASWSKLEHADEMA